MRVLLTNDDGIMAPGLAAMYRELAKEHKVSVVAPDAERSAVGHAITLADPLRVTAFNGRDGMKGFAVSGTPADCVKIAVRAILRKPPDLVISGINAGANVGTNVLYSGTVSAATEAALLGLPAMAVSVRGRPKSFAAAVFYAMRMAGIINRYRLPPGVSLNVNIPNLPPGKIKGVKATRMGRYRVIEWFDRRLDPRGNIYYWQAGESAANKGGPALTADDAALRAGYVSVTPLFPDLTADAFLPELAEWIAAG